MGTGSKILFIEDETSKDNSIMDALEAANLITGDIDDRNALNDETNGNIVIATSFADAFKRIISLGDGSEYEWIFIDRNLAEYAISSENNEKLDEYTNSDTEYFSIDSKVFKKDFFKSLLYTVTKDDNVEKLILAGDYLFATLVNAGVPIEKICFLTANNDSSIEMLEQSLYLHTKRLPQIIDKTPDGYGELKKILKDSHKAKIRFLYRDIFNNIKVKDIFSPYIEDFITILAKRYKSGTEAEYTKGDGILLRNMIEAIVAYIADDNNFKNRLNDPKEVDTVRRFLNCDLLGYSREFEKKLSHIHTNFKKVCNKLNKKVLNKNDESDIRNHIQKYSKDIDKETDLIIEYSNAKILTALNDFYFHDPYDFPPKYIFSYIDNIYTVTSEFSAHGKNDNTTDDLLSTDGWSALLSGMLEIMKWVAKENPNPASHQS